MQAAPSLREPVLFWRQGPLKPGSTTVSSRCSHRKTRSASCTRARRGRVSTARARHRQQVGPGSLLVAEEEVEPARLSVKSVPLDSEDEPNEVGSLSVDEGALEDGGDASRRKSRRRRFPSVATSVGRLRSAGLCNCNRIGRAVRLATTVRVGAIAPRSSA